MAPRVDLTFAPTDAFLVPRDMESELVPLLALLERALAVRSAASCGTL